MRKECGESTNDVCIYWRDEKRSVSSAREQDMLELIIFKYSWLLSKKKNVEEKKKKIRKKRKIGAIELVQQWSEIASTEN